MYSKMMTRAFAGLITLMLLCGPAFTVNAQNYFVATNGNDSASGTNWENALLTISNAIVKASAGQTVAVSNGTYVLTTQLLLNKGITLQGFGGASNTIINANASGRAITISSTSAILDGFTIRNGSVSGNGGGISMSLGQVKNCIVTSNTISGTVNGGGVYMTGGILRDSTVGNNLVSPYYADGRGGGVYVSGGAIVTNCLISGNVVDNTTDLEWARGGGVCIFDGTVVGCTITNNKVNRRWRNSSYGGGVYLEHANAILDRCIVTGNEVSMLGGSDSGRLGGGVVIRAGVARNCLIAGNQARNQAGGVWMDGGTLESCTIVRNAAVTADYGGVFRGGGTVLNCIIWNNTSVGVAPNITNDTSVTYSCAPSLTSGTGNIPADPFFVDSGNGSGLSFTTGDYRPVIGSPCEKTGFVSSWMSTALDLAGFSRLNGAQVDMGCHLVYVPPKDTYVSESGNDSNDGTSWSTAFKTIQKGIDAATGLGTVSVSNGTYVLTSQLLLGKGCTLIGLGGSSNTIIDANASGRIITVDNASAVVEGFTLKNGKSATAINGTGVNMTGGTLRNCTVTACTNNTQTYSATPIQGVGIYMTGGTVETCTIEKNMGGNIGMTVNGGGLYMAGSGCLVTNCLISDNYGGQEFATSKGGGAYLSAGKLLSSVFRNNTLNAGRSTGGGGGVFVTGGGIVSNCTISANSVTCVDALTRGGGVYIDGGAVSDCIVSNNASRTGWDLNRYTVGGGIYMSGTALVERCVITRNYQTANASMPRYGAGVASEGGTMRSCLIMGNTANTLGGGLYITAGTNENCTIVRNDCSGGNYGGVYWTNTPVIVNAIVYNNTGAIENNILPIIGGVSGVTYSCSPSLTSGTGNITADPLFTASGSGSGTTFTPGDYRLAAGTPCRNKGLTEVRMKTTTDLDRLPRVKDFLVDMGAYERQTNSGTMIKFF
jgi:hypothetical protein